MAYRILNDIQKQQNAYPFECTWNILSRRSLANSQNKSWQNQMSEITPNITSGHSTTKLDAGNDTQMEKVTNM